MPQGQRPMARKDTPMNICSDCYWKDQCGGLTISACSDHTPLEDDGSEEELYLATVRADNITYAKAIPDDDDVGSVHYKSRNTAQRLHI